jgi:hypothetical protein
MEGMAQTQQSPVVSNSFTAMQETRAIPPQLGL